uniref:Uncharacterized protein n=1 Tax=Rhipicephalus microplus TaxID=6941 RepID=A0A6G5AHL0_RHIMP
MLSICIHIYACTILNCIFITELLVSMSALNYCILQILYYPIATRCLYIYMCPHKKVKMPGQMQGHREVKKFCFLVTHH